MTDPVRLIDEGATDFERALLDSAADEMPSPALSKKMMAGLSGVVALGAVSTTTSYAAGKASAASAFQWGLIIKWGLCGVAAALLGWGGYASLKNDSPARAPAAAPAAPSPRPIAPGEEAHVDESGVVSKSVSDSASDPAPASRAVPPPQLSPTERATKGAPDSARLREELALLDQARTALKSEQPERALRIVAAYEKKFPHGSLRQEATVLKVEALKVRGREGQADALTEDFLKENPDSAHKTRLKSTGDKSSQSGP